MQSSSPPPSQNQAITPGNRVRRSRSWTVMDGTNSPFVPRPDKRKRSRLDPESPAVAAAASSGSSGNDRHGRPCEQLCGIQEEDSVVARTPDTVIIKTPTVAAPSHRDHHIHPCEQRGGVLEEEVEEDVVVCAPESAIIETPTVMRLRRTMMLWIWSSLRSWMPR